MYSYLYICSQLFPFSFIMSLSDFNRIHNLVLLTTIYLFIYSCLNQSAATTKQDLIIHYLNQK